MLHDVDLLIRPEGKSVRVSFPRLSLHSMDHSRLLFTRILSRLLAGGIPLLSALRKMKESMKDPKWQEAVAMMEFDLSEGQSLSECMARASEISKYSFFPNFYFQMIRAGEETGKLEKILTVLENYLAKRIQRKQRIREACAYPGLVLLMGSAAVMILLRWVIPNIARVYDGLSVPMPAITRFLVGIGQVPLSGVILGGLVTYFILKQGKFLPFFWEKITAVQPLKAIFDNERLSHFSLLLAIHLQSGVPIVPALDSCSKIFSSKIDHSIQKTREQISQGSGISQSLKKISWMDASSLALLEAGETSGRLEESLFRVSEDSTCSFESDLEWLVKLIEPLLIVFIGAIIGALVLGVLLPILNLQEMMQ